MRESRNEMKDGKLVNGFDYDLQVWVIDGVIQECGHPTNMQDVCNACKYQGKKLSDVKGGK